MTRREISEQEMRLCVVEICHYLLVEMEREGKTSVMTVDGPVHPSIPRRKIAAELEKLRAAAGMVTP